MVYRSFATACALLLVSSASACTLDLDRDDDSVVGALDAGWEGSPDAGDECSDDRCGDGDAGVRPGFPDAGAEPGRDAGSPACDAGRPFPGDAGFPPDRDGGVDPRPEDAGFPPDRDGGIDPWPDAGGGWPIEDGGVRPDASSSDASWPDRDDAGAGSDCEWISSEAVCVVTPGCVAWYEGVDCMCDDEGRCECAEWVFASCE